MIAGKRGKYDQIFWGLNLNRETFKKAYRMNRLLREALDSQEKKQNVGGNQSWLFVKIRF